MKAAVVIVVLLLVVVTWTGYSVAFPPSLADHTDLPMMATMISKDMNTGLYSRDFLYADQAHYNFYTPIYRQVIGWLWRLSGSFELALLYLVPVLLVIYLPGMYLLLSYTTGSRWNSLALTVISANYHVTIGPDLWGVADSAGMLARTLFMAFVPWLALLFLVVLKQPRLGWLALLGLGTGLVTNLHAVSGFNFVLLLAATYILVHGRRWQAWVGLAVQLLATGVGALPFLLNVAGHTQIAVPAAVDFEKFSEAVRYRLPVPFNPTSQQWPLLGIKLTRPTLDGLVWVLAVAALLALGLYLWNRRYWPAGDRWLWLAGGLGVLAYGYMLAFFNTPLLFIIAGLYVVYKFWRRDITPLDGWLLTLAALTCLISFAVPYYLEWAWRTFKLWSLTSFLVSFVRTSRFIYWPVYSLVGLAAVAFAGAVQRWLDRPARTGLEREETLGPASPAAVVAAALMLLLIPGLSRHLSGNGLALIAGLGILIGGAVALTWLLARGAAQRLASWAGPVTLLAAGMLLYSPLGRPLSTYLPVPNVTWPPVAASPANQDDTELYRWVEASTSADALFLTCFGPTTTTLFRFYTGRSVTDNWKDLGFLVLGRPDLAVPYYERHLRLEAACEDVKQAVAAADQEKADFILAATGQVGDMRREACFSNEKYAVFALQPGVCLPH